MSATLYQWFAATAERFPSETALEFGPESLDYQGLSQRADDLAAQLMSGRSQPPSRVAFAAERSLGAYVAFLAIQRLGATVVPLNPRHPVARSLDICQQAEIDMAVVTLGAPNPFLAAPRRFRPPIFHVDEEGSAVDDLRPGELPPTPADPESGAYLMFTSGTQGRPKGVLVTHRNIGAFLSVSIPQFEIGPGTRFPQFFAFTFDASVADMFLSWGGGATLVPPTPPEVLDPLRYIRRARLTHWFSVPSSVRIADSLGTLEPGAAASVRHSMFGAEPLPHKQMLLWQKVAPNTVVWNMYGPTETAVVCTAQGFRGPAEDWPVAPNGTLPIGEAYEGTQLAILDPEGREADVGELCIRGEQRFAGYLDPQENVGRFVAFEPGGVATQVRGPVRLEHWYRTGDLVARTTLGLIHRGRLDQQVKVRGHRVEIGEVEAAIHRHPQVKDVAVIVDRSGDDTALVGFYVADDLSDADLDAWLRTALPGSMVPSHLHRMRAIPLNDNGKIDRVTLAKLTSAGTGTTGTG